LIVPAGVEIVTERSELGTLEPEWRSLAERRANAFVAPEWFRAWLDGMGPAARPFVPVVRRADGGLRGLLPLVATTRAFRTLRFAGGAFADRIHPVAAPEDEAAVAIATASALFDGGSARTLLRLDHVEVEADWVDRLLETTSPALGARRTDRTVLPYIDLRALNWETFLATRSANFRSQLSRKLKALERRSVIRFRRTVDSAELDSDLTAFFELHDKRWQALGGGSTLADPMAREALTRFARAAFGAGWLRLWFLEVDRRPAAAWYGWHLGGRYTYYQAGLDPDWSSSSLGFLLLARTVRAAFEEGAEVYELLAGAEDFKRRLATGEEEVDTLVVSRHGRPERAITAVGIGVRHLVRRLPHGVRNGIRSLRGASRL
jgi:CelD/BcsL family acetyltransferase involved in cellulose biosynthesis